jgi:hypothetical protein
MKKGTIIGILYLLINLSCNKANQSANSGGYAETVNSLFGVIVKTDDGFEILTDEKGLLLPSTNLPENLKIDSQPVTVSGMLNTPIKKIREGFNITPIEISDIKLRASNYDKTDIKLTIIKNENKESYLQTFEYFIEDLRTDHGTRILQPYLPAVSGFIPFTSVDQAIRTALLHIYIIRNGNSAVTEDVLKYIHVIN